MRLATAIARVAGVPGRGYNDGRMRPLARSVALVLLIGVSAGCEALVKRSQLGETEFSWSYARDERSFQGRFGSPAEPPADATSLDVGRLLDAMPAGERFAYGRVTVQHPPELAALARQTAVLADAAYARIEERTGIRIGFDASLVLVPVPSVPETFHYVSGAGPATWPVLVPDGVRDAGRIFAANLFPYTFIHEVVEATLVTGAGGHNPILNDLEVGFVVPLYTIEGETRWFREGVANYAGLIALDLFEASLGTPLPLAHPRPLVWLGALGLSLTAWTQADGGMLPGHHPEEYYSAALGLIIAISARTGSDRWIRATRAAIDRMPYGDGRSLRQAIAWASGVDPVALARAFRLPDAGIVGTSVRVPVIEAGPAAGEVVPAASLVRVMAGVEVVDVAPGGSAAAAGLAPEDLILAANGRPTRSMEDLDRALLDAGAGGVIALDVATFHDGPRRVEVRLPVR